MPHMLIVEALAQLSAFVHTSDSNGLGFLSSLDGVTFHEKHIPVINLIYIMSYLAIAEVLFSVKAPQLLIISRL